MIGELEKFPDSSMLWVFPSPEVLDSNMKSVIDKHLLPFINTWQAHGKDVLGAYWIANEHFVCIAAHSDVALPTGCAIDAMTHAVAKAEDQLQLDLRDRSQVFIQNDSGEITKIHFSQIGDYIKQGLINSNSQIFQTSINSLHDFRNNWLISAQNSWLKRFFTKKAIIS